MSKLVKLFVLLVSLAVLGLWGGNVYAAVAHDAASESHTGSAGSTGQASFTWTHTPAGTPRGVLVYVFTISATQTVTGVTYGGVAMTQVAGGAAADTAGEPGRVDTFFLGASIPTGTQSIVVNRTNNGTIMYASAATQIAGRDTEVTGIVLLQESGTYAVQPVNDGSPGTNSLRYAAGYSGGNNVLVAGTGSTVLNSIDFGSYTATTARESTAGQGARNVGFTYTTSDDRAAVHLAVRERPLPPTVTSITPNTGPTAGGTSVTIAGTNFVTGAGATTVMIGGNACTSPFVSSPSLMTCNTPAGSAGTASVLVTTAGGTNSANTLYTYVAPPTVTGITPNTGPIAGGTSVTIAGTNFVTGAGATTVTIAGNPCTSPSVSSPTSMTCNTPAGSAGTASVLVTTSGGTNSANTFYTYVVPSVISINTASVNPTTIGSAVAWTVLFNTSVTGVSAANFQLVPGVGVAGATITSVTPAPGSSTTTWTVNAYVGTGPGILGLNMANVTSIIPAVTTSMPFVGQTYTIYPKLTCVVAVDTFTGANNSAPDSGNWDVQRVSGSFTPLIYGNRLRITDTSGYVATRATNKNIFNFGNNVVVAEFDYWAYGGTGAADGIAITFSDPNFGGTALNNPPIAGGFGGSLGYANRDTSGTCNVNGFKGGWIGVGIDEYGNYSNPLSFDGSSTECRNGGPGVRTNAVAIRGSGSGATSPSTSNYYYLAGTPALGANGVSTGSTSTAYHYRITLDASSDTSKVMVKLEQDRNAGAGYSTLISYDLKPDITAGRQTALPSQLQFTFTGSTGASTNYHEVDNLSICTSSAVSILDHVAIDAPTAAMTSTAVPVIISPHDAAHAAFPNAGTISLSTSTGAGDWSIGNGGGTFTPGAANSGLATYTFGSLETSVTLNFTYQSAATVTLNVAGAGGSNLLLNTPAVEKANTIVFTTSGLVFTDHACVHNIAFGGVGQTCALLNWSPQVAGQTLNSIYITNVSAGRPTRFSQSNSTTRNMQYGLSCHDPATNAGKLATFSATANTFPLCQSNGATPTTWTTATNITFPANIPSAGPFSFNYPDVGEVEFWMRNFASQTQTGSSGAFVVKPGGFVLTAIKRTSDNFANPAAADAAGTAFIKAGEAFSVTVTATTCSTATTTCTVVGAATPNYGKESTPESVKLTSALVTGLVLSNNPTITCSDSTNPATCDTTTTPATPIPKFGAFTASVATGVNFAWNDVGIITLTPSVGDGDYLGAGDLVVRTPSGNVGRFIPHHFDTAVTGLMTCTGLTFATACPAGGLAYSGQPFSVQVTAKNAGGNPTQNYQGAFAKVVTLSAVAGVGVTTAPTGAGTMYFYDTTLTTPADATPAKISSFTAGIGSDSTVKYVFTTAPTPPTDIYLRAMDTDSVSSLRTADVPTPTVPATSVEGGVKVVSGRIKIPNMYGSERLALPMTVTVQYYNGTYWLTSLTDSVNGLTDPAISPKHYLTTVSPADVGTLPHCPLTSTSIGVSTVVAGMGIITLPAPVVACSANITINAPSYLPATPARATFGTYKSPLIYRRENY